MFKAKVDKLKRYRGLITETVGKPVIVTRTGYTGEDGFELIVRAEEAQRVWENLLLAGRDAGFKAAGLGARDTLRLEAGMPLYGHELSESINPLEADLAFACNLEDRTFIGSESLAEVRAAGPSRMRVGLAIEGKRPVREGCEIVDENGTVVGTVTSGAPSPTLGRPIAMAYLDAKLIDPATKAVRGTIQINNRGTLQPASVVPLPFYNGMKS